MKKIKFKVIKRYIIISLTKYFCISSDPTTRKKVADVWLATAFASSVFPAKENIN